MKAFGIIDMNKNISTDFIVFFRIAIGLIVFLHFISMWEDFDLLYTNDSIIPLEINTIYNLYSIVTIEDIFNWLTNIVSYENAVLIIKFSYLFLCILIIIGFFSRIAALLLLFLQVSFIKYGSLYFYGADFFTEMSLFYIFIFPSSSYYSLQKLLLPNFSKNWQSINLCKVLIQSHLCIAYFFSGLGKVLGFNWWNGESVWKAMNLPNLHHTFNVSEYTQNPLLYIFIGWATIIIELFYPIFININRTRKIWLILTISMHIGIIFSLNLFFFSAIMITWNLTTYYFNYYEKSNFKNTSIDFISSIRA